jgi:hypothetical protein
MSLVQCLRLLDVMDKQLTWQGCKFPRAHMVHRTLDIGLTGKGAQDSGALPQ